MKKNFSVKNKNAPKRTQIALINSSRRLEKFQKLCFLLFVGGFIFFCSGNLNNKKVAAADETNEIEKAMFTRQEFFGAKALMPLPTSEVRENLLKLSAAAPDNPQILEKLAEVNEKLTLFDEAEKNLIRLTEIDSSKLENLAEFYERRAEFEKEATILRLILSSTASENRASAFEKLIYTARRHDLKAYLQPDFYSEVAKDNPNLYEIFEKLADNLNEVKNYSEALNFTRRAKEQFPARRSVLLAKEINILLEMKKPQEAEKIYRAAFDPFWSENEAQKFYDFLNEQNRLRAYGAEIKARFKKNPADFDAAIKFAHYQNYDSNYDNDQIAPVILRLEQAKKSWTTDELIIVTRLLLQSSEGDLASRFLYTLYNRVDFQKDSGLRAKILYQLFEMFSDAEDQKLPITKGDLRFYEDVAKADTNPGIATGILSLVFSDTNPRQKLEDQESAAMKYFNRAAAYRIFEAYKAENPDSPELAQIYLDIVRLYTATKETEIAEKTFDEFAGKYQDSKDFADAALKLADAFIAAKDYEKSREIYQKILDYLGKIQKPKLKLNKSAQFPEDFSTSGNRQISPVSEESEDEDLSPTRNDGINIPAENEKPKNDYYDDSSVFNDFLGRKTAAITYEEVLGKLFVSLSNERKFTEILRVYSNEIAKYPDEEWLYEQRIAWLEQTNLVEEQLRVYKETLNQFQTNNWRDKLARFFVRQKRQNEFADFSTDLVGKLNDADVQSYLSQFIDGKFSATDFDGQLYFKLYQSAHARFPHNINFVNGLLRYYQSKKLEVEWRNLAAEYYFESKEVRGQFLDNLAQRNKMREYLAQAQNAEGAVYELFRADAAIRLSNYENAVETYRRLNQIYPNTPEFADKLISLTRSFGQKNREMLNEAANNAKARADFEPSLAVRRTQSGEIFAELGDYQKSGEEWEKLPLTAKGDKEVYLDAATVYWDYFQFDDALKTIRNLREKFGDDTLYAFEMGAILEAQNKKIEAVGEYVKALDARDEESTEKEKAINRLKFLTAKYPNGNSNSENIEILPVEAAFEFEKSHRKDSAFLTLGYSEFLAKIKQPDKAEKILNQAVGQSSNVEFLEAAKDFFQTEEIKSGEQTTLRRLADISTSPRSKIQLALQLAESFEENQDRRAAKSVLNQLVADFPTNFGVLTETSDFYKRLGFEDESAQVLQNALGKSKGKYHSALAQKLAARLINLNRLDSAEEILMNLHAENKGDEEVFRELAKICVRTGNVALMRQSFAETVTELKKSTDEPREIDERVAELREEMIDAFTRLKDFQSAIEQHIETINREPENEALTENAIRYVQRYGGAAMLLNYYLKLSAEAFKNYRWNVVLARIYTAGNDAENAVRNYRAAIVNQPEMPELYLAISEIEAKRNNFDEALKNLDEVLLLTNDAPEMIKKKIEVLKKAGRFSEIAEEEAKLPVETKKEMALEEFAEAAKLAQSEKEKARDFYRQAFDKLLANPLETQFQTADINAYVELVREEEPLDRISEKLWSLREKLISISVAYNSTGAGEARKRLGILDGALTESIGGIAGNFGTNEELAALHENLSRKVSENSFASNNHQILFLIQDVSRRAGFGDLEEKILQKRIDEDVSTSDRDIYVQNLVNFYNERGAYQKTFNVLEKYQPDNFSQIAETARLLGNKEKELAALRKIYQNLNDKTINQNNADVARYLEILYHENRQELQSLTEESSPYQLQLINFLLGKGEGELTHSAIENSNFPIAWKYARNAETSLALKEIGEKSECYFCDALQFDSIGNLILQSPDKTQFLINDDWFQLTREYGEWLGEKPNAEMQSDADKYLTAMTENLPESAVEQTNLGAFYLERNKFDRAIEHFRLAVEINPSDKIAQASLGAAYYKAGQINFAEEIWAQILEDETIQSGSIYFQNLRRYGLEAKARDKLPPIIVKFLQSNNADQSEDFQNLIRSVAESFTDENEKSAYFLGILEQRPTDKSLAAMLISENLVSENEQNEFYEILIAKNGNLRDHDYNFQLISQRIFNPADVESVYGQENEYKIEEPSDEAFEWRKKYLELLIKKGETSRIVKLIAETEKQLNGKFTRPNWLRLGNFRLQIRQNQFNLAEAEQFVGIRVSESATEIIPPSVERFNDVIGVLNEANPNNTNTRQLSESYFARMLALEQFDTANFAGLARAFFQKGEAENGLLILRLMIKANERSQKQLAEAEIASLGIIKPHVADATKLAATENNSIDKPNALKVAAEIALEFNQRGEAVGFRREIISTNSSDADNKIKLAEILFADNRGNEAAQILQSIVADRNSLRSARWRSIEILRENNVAVDVPNIIFDSFSQFYLGVFHLKTNQNEASIESFINSLIANSIAETSARQELIKIYASTNKPFASLKLADSDKSNKPDELLQMLSEAAEKTGDLAKALEFENSKKTQNSERIRYLQQLDDERNRRATNFTVDKENTRKL